MFHLEKLVAQYISELSIKRQEESAQCIYIGDAATERLPCLMFLLRFYKERVRFIPTTIDFDSQSLQALFADINGIVVDEDERGDWFVQVASFLRWMHDCEYISDTLWDSLQDALSENGPIGEIE